MIELKPIRESQEEYDEIEKRIKILFKKEIYIPLLKEFYKTSSVLKNSKEDLIDAIKSGQITFNKGKFSGKFNASISKELRELGAKWNSASKVYSINSKELPFDIRDVISASEFKFISKISAIDQKLSKIIPEELAKKLNISKFFDRTIFKVNKEFEKSIGNITIAPKLTDDARARIADEWQGNMHLWIKNFTEEQIIKLRKDMQKSVLAGNRYESAVKSIQDSYGVTANKAKFLARQETALLMTKLKETRYQDAGINEYKWKSVSGTKLHPVRARHKELNDASQIKGTIFRFDDPPVTSEAGQATRRNNPGADYNCRCTSVPVIRKVLNPK